MPESDPVWARWEAIDRVFAAVLDVPDGERGRALTRICGDDTELFVAVADLLDLSRSDDTRGTGPGAHLLREVCDPDGPGGPDTLGPGARVGRYRIVDVLGHGGMATVFEAERSDGAYRQRVALKILRRGLDTDRILARFLAERQILSDFDHPNIARLLDGGATESGRPYLVMEKVDGERLTDWADRRKLNTEERLSLFLQVTEAVQEAHRRLVVHRDIKPSNILVNADGRAKLLDFGIAKLLDHSDPDLTQLGAYPLTRRYASPEQLRGERVTTSSDVYQLGLLLCELLAGVWAFDESSGGPSGGRGGPLSPSALFARVGEGRADELASQRATTPRALERSLRGDLDTIVMKALQPEPLERYRSVEDLDRDLRLHLDGRPIRARPATRWLELGKWLGRNRWAPPVAAVFCVLAIGYAVTLTLSASRLEEERNEARAQAERAEQVTAFLTAVFEATDPNELGRPDLTVVELLDMSAERAITELEGQSETQAEVLSTIGAMYQARGQFERAVAVMERAVELRRTVDGNPADLVRDLRRFAGSLRNDERAVPALEEAVEVAERELGADTPLLAATLTDLATRLASRGLDEDRQRARDMIERAVRILRAQTGDVRAELATALNRSAVGGDLAGLPRLEEALELRRSLYGEDHTLVAGTLNDMALLLEPYDPEAADTLLERAAEINARIHGPNHARTLTILNNLAGRYRDRGDFEKAEPLFRDLLRRRLEAYPAARIQQAYTMHGLGWSLTELGRPEEAEPLLREVVRRTDPGPGRTTTVHEMARSTLGRCLAAQGRYLEAEPLLRESYSRAAARAPRSVHLPIMLERLIDFYDTLGRPDEAEPYRRALREPVRLVEQKAP